MKKNSLLTFMIVTLFACISFAEAYTCNFTGNVNEDSSWWNTLIGTDGYFKIDIDDQNKKIKPTDGDVNEVIDEYINSEWTPSKIIEKLEGDCPSSVVVCRMNNLDAGTTGIFLLMNDTLEAELIEKDKITIPRKTVFGTAYISYQYDSCVWFDYVTEGSTSGSKDVIYDCEIYDDLIKELNGSYKNDFSKFNNIKSKIKTFCNSVYKHLDVKNSCTKRCLTLEDEPAMKGDLLNNSGKCGFSEKLILWIANIIRWVKYIVPVVVIVLGILDFMKAISADKEDEMKKAQQRFIRRLIAAALIFIAPFIIEFILNKLGFDSNGCGIINL